MLSGRTLLNRTLVIDADPGGTNEVFYLMKAPVALTVEAVYVTSEQAQNAGTAVTAQVLNWGTAGTSVDAAGTVHAAVGGTATASRLSARTPAVATINAAQNYFDAGDWMVVNYGEEGAGWIAGDRFTVDVHYVLGKGNTTA
jgi:hypothetical protein